MVKKVFVERRLRVGAWFPTYANPIRYQPIQNAVYAGRHPGRDFFDCMDTFRALENVRVTHLIDLTEPHEKTTAGDAVYQYDRDSSLQIRGLLCSRFPIVDDHPPKVASCVRICRHIDAVLADGGRVYVHCRGGIGRTGTIVAAYLVWSGMASAKNVFRVLDRIRLHERRDAPMPLQMAWLREEWFEHVDRLRSRKR